MLVILLPNLLRNFQNMLNLINNETVRQLKSSNSLQTFIASHSAFVTRKTSANEASLMSV